MRFVDILLVEFDREAGLTRQVLERLPGDRFDWQPHPRSRTLGQLALGVGDLLAGKAVMAAEQGAELPVAPSPIVSASRHSGRYLSMSVSIACSARSSARR